MNRKIYLLLTVLMAWSFSLKAQTAQIESITANPGDAVTFDIDVASLPADVGAVSLYIGYDPNVLTFTGATAGTMTGYFINNMVGSNQVGIQWSDPNGANLNGTLITLNFQYSALGGACDLTFDPGCEFTDISLNPVAVSYTNGNIGPNVGVATITIDEIVATAGPVSLGVTGAGFTANIGAMTLYIAFDPGILQFSGFTSTLPNLQVSGNNTTGLVSVAYSDPGGSPINLTFLTLNFNYNGTGTSELVFTGGCEVAYTDLTIEIVSYNNGKVEPLATAYQLTIDDVIGTPGNPVGINITAAGFPTDVAAITLNIGFNQAHLDFLNITPGTITGAYASIISPGLLGITWTNWSGQGIDGTLLTMNFDYNFGSSAITFEGGSEISNTSLILIPTTFNDGSISPVVGGPEVSLPIKTGTVGQPIDFPVRAKNFTMDVAAISLFIGYSNSVLTYTGHTPGTITGYYINNMVSTSQLGVQWTNYLGVDIDPNGDDTLFTLHFTYIGGESPLTFDAGSEFARSDLSIIPVSFLDGAVVLILGSQFNIKAFLEGPFNGATMNVTLNSSGYLPLAHPYGGAPWNYAGTESVGVIPNGYVVDWVLLEIRETAGAANTATSATVVAQQAAFILNTGYIVALDGVSPVLLPTTFSDDVYLVIYHRNHLSMMSATPVPVVGDIYTYDFTTAQGQAYLNGQKTLTGGFGGMYSGDGNADGFINNIDLFAIWLAQVGFIGYYEGDYSMDSFVNNIDLFAHWLANVGNISQIP